MSGEQTSGEQMSGDQMSGEQMSIPNVRGTNVIWGTNVSGGMGTIVPWDQSSGNKCPGTSVRGTNAVGEQMGRTRYADLSKLL